MAGYTKAQYDDQYALRAEREWGHPNTRAEIRLHYQRKVMEPYLHPRWDAIHALLGFAATDRVVIAGAGFGWSIDYLASLVPGITLVGVDISDYIDAEKGSDDTAEIDAYITAGGLDPATDRGKQIRDKWASPGVNKATQIVLKESMLSNGSRNRVRQRLGNAAPTHIITEDMIQEFSLVEISDWVSELNKLTSTAIIHVITNEVDRTAEEVNALTGHRTLLVGTTVDKDVG